MDDSFNRRFKNSISSLLKDMSPRCKMPSEPSGNSEKKKKYMFASRILSLKQRIGILPAPKQVAAEDIDHDTVEGRDIFFNQLCYLLQTKIPDSQYYR